MFTISIKSNIAEFARDFDRKYTKQMRPAIANALSRIVRIARTDLQQEVKSSFDRPTPWTVNSIYTKAATAQTLTATIRFKDEGSGGLPAHYLLPQVAGGPRPFKRMEGALRSRGVLPNGLFAVPGSGAKLDAYGNMSRGQIMQILSALRASETVAGHTSDRTARSMKRRRNLPKFFIAGPGSHLPAGVWQRFSFAYGSAIKPVLMFVRQPRYRKRLRFTETVQGSVDRNFAREMRNELTMRIPGTK